MLIQITFLWKITLLSQNNIFSEKYSPVLCFFNFLSMSGLTEHSWILMYVFSSWHCHMLFWFKYMKKTWPHRDMYCLKRQRDFSRLFRVAGILFWHFPQNLTSGSFLKICYNVECETIKGAFHILCDIYSWENEGGKRQSNILDLRGK